MRPSIKNRQIKELFPLRPYLLVQKYLQCSWESDHMHKFWIRFHLKNFIGISNLDKLSPIQLSTCFDTRNSGLVAILITEYSPGYGISAGAQPWRMNAAAYRKKWHPHSESSTNYYLELNDFFWVIKLNNFVLEKESYQGLI